MNEWSILLPLSLFSQGKIPCYVLSSRLCWTDSRFGRFRENRNLLPLPKIPPPFLVNTARGLAAKKLFVLMYICLFSKARHPLNPYLLKIFPYYIYCRLLFIIFETCKIAWVTSYSRNVITSVMKLAPASNCLFTMWRVLRAPKWTSCLLQLQELHE